MTNEKKNTIIIGSRGSLLARTQTGWVRDRIVEANPGLEVRIEIFTTRGDQMQSQPLPDIGGKGLFTEELEAALVENRIDLAVHSVKDLPTDTKPGLAVLAFPEREDPRDAWVSADGTPFAEIAAGSVVGTSSLRRQSQLLMQRGELSFIALRGNVDTRIKKVHRGDCVGAVLAMAGLKRVGLEEHATHAFEPEDMLPAPGQGALGIQGRAHDERVIACVAPIRHEPTVIAVDCERAILHALDAGCRAPVGIFAVQEGDQLVCRALVSDPMASQVARAEEKGSPDDWQSIADRIVADLREAGADKIIDSCRTDDD